MDATNKFLKECAILICYAQSIDQTYQGEQNWHNVENNFNSVIAKANDLFAETRAMYCKQDKFDLATSYDKDAHKHLTKNFTNWIQNKITHTDDFEWQVVNHTQKSIIEWTSRNHKKTLWISPTSYWSKEHLENYHNDVQIYKHFTDITKKSTVILDLPHRGSLTVPDDYEEMMTWCSDNDIDVFIDATFMLLHNGKLDLNYDCIRCVNVSFSKFWPVAGIGCTITGYKDPIPFDHYNMQKNVCQSLKHWFEKYPYDDYYKKLKNKQKQWCEFLDLKPSTCVSHAVADNDLQQWWTHKHWNKTDFVEKQICLIPLFENTDLIKNYFDIKNDI